MTTRLLSLLFFLTFLESVYAGRVSGTVRDVKGEVLPFCSILVKGTTLGTTANKDGKYFLNLGPGNYTLVCQHVGFTKIERAVTLTEQDRVEDFVLAEQQLSMKEGDQETALLQKSRRFLSVRSLH